MAASDWDLDLSDSRAHALFSHDLRLFPGLVSPSSRCWGKARGSSVCGPKSCCRHSPQLIETWQLGQRLDGLVPWPVCTLPPALPVLPVTIHLKQPHGKHTEGRAWSQTDWVPPGPGGVMEGKVHEI